MATPSVNNIKIETSIDQIEDGVFLGRYIVNPIKKRKEKRPTRLNQSKPKFSVFNDSTTKKIATPSVNDRKIETSIDQIEDGFFLGRYIVNPIKTRKEKSPTRLNQNSKSSDIFKNRKTAELREFINKLLIYLNTCSLNTGYNQSPSFI